MTGVWRRGGNTERSSGGVGGAVGSPQDVHQRRAGVGEDGYPGVQVGQLVPQVREDARLDRRNAPALLADFFAELPRHMEGGPEAHSGTMLSSYPFGSV